VRASSSLTVNTVIVNYRSFNGWGVTAFDALDTMLLMDLKDEYQRALKIVRNADFTKSQVSLLTTFFVRKVLNF